MKNNCVIGFQMSKQYQGHGIEFSQLKNDCVIACLYEDDGKWYVRHFYGRVKVALT